MSKQTKPTVAGLRKAAEELVALYPATRRFERLKEQVKADMAALNWDQVAVAGGVVKLDRYDRTEIPVSLAIEHLEAMAEKIIQRKTTVSIELLDAFVKVGEIPAETAKALKDAGNKTPVTSLKITTLPSDTQPALAVLRASRVCWVEGGAS
jgi:hypothetical protein